MALDLFLFSSVRPHCVSDSARLTQTRSSAQQHDGTCFLQLPGGEAQCHAGSAGQSSASSSQTTVHASGGGSGLGIAIGQASGAADGSGAGAAKGGAVTVQIGVPPVLTPLQKLGRTRALC